MYKLSRFCVCGRELFYSCSDSYNLAEKNNGSCRSCATSKYAKRIGDCKRLLNNSLESYYWIGFILADGHIQDNKRLVVGLSIKDVNHLKKLAEYLKITVKEDNEKCYLAIMDTKSITILSKIFDIKSNKTENPPNIDIFSSLPDDVYNSLMCGFIDGDGSIRRLHKRKDFNIKIKCHSSWFAFLELFTKRLNVSTKVKINKAGYADLAWSNTKEIQDFKKIVLKYNLPLLSRKWETINLDYKSRYIITKERVEYVKEQLLLGKNQTEIAKNLGISNSGLSLLIKRKNLKNETK